MSRASFNFSLRSNGPAARRLLLGSEFSPVRVPPLGRAKIGQNWDEIEKYSHGHDANKRAFVCAATVSLINVEEIMP